MNKNLQKSHFCNTDDFYFRIASASVYDNKYFGLKHSAFHVKSSILELCEEFKYSYHISYSTYIRLEKTPIFCRHPSVLAEVIDCLNLTPEQKIPLLKDCIKRGSGSRSLSYYSFYSKVQGYKIKSKLKFIDPFRVSLNGSDATFRQANKLKTISISPYNFMSFGHYAWPIMACNLLLDKKLSSILIWANSDNTADDGAFLNLVKSSCIDDIKIISPMETELTNALWEFAYESSHIFHMKHNSSNLLDYQTCSQRLKNLLTPAIESTSNVKKLIFHTRDNEYKEDSNSNEASTRNSSEKNLVDALIRCYGDYNMINWNSFIASLEKNEMKRQWEEVGDADLLVTSMSGLSFMCQYTGTPVIFHNSTNFCLGYDIPLGHLFVPKRIVLKKQEFATQKVEKNKLLRWLAGDWSFNPYFIKYISFQEVDKNTLIDEFNIFINGKGVDIMKWFIDKSYLYDAQCKDIPLNHPPRMVSLKTIKMFEDVIENA